MSRPRVVMVRHGNWNYRDDKILPEEWQRAKLFGEKLSGFSFAKVFSSRANRTYETAKALCSTIEPEQIDYLAEFPTDPGWQKKVFSIQRKERRDLVEIVFSIEELRMILRERSGVLSVDLWDIAKDVPGDSLMVSHGVTMTALVLAAKEWYYRNTAGDKRCLLRHEEEPMEASRLKQDAELCEQEIPLLWLPESYKGNRFGPLDAKVFGLGEGYLTDQEFIRS